MHQGAPTQRPCSLPRDYGTAMATVRLQVAQRGYWCSRRRRPAKTQSVLFVSNTDSSSLSNPMECSSVCVVLSPRIISS